jgi:hypothetical protein
MARIKPERGIFCRPKTAEECAKSDRRPTAAATALSARVSIAIRAA